MNNHRQPTAVAPSFNPWEGPTPWLTEHADAPIEAIARQATP